MSTFVPVIQRYMGTYAYKDNVPTLLVVIMHKLKHRCNYHKDE
jgi:hypothetical protein